MNKEYIVIVGTRPNFVKAAALLRYAKKYPGCKFTLIHTGQHYDANMSDVFFRDLEIPEPDYFLNGMSMGGQIARIREITLSTTPDGVIVFGDVRSSLLAAAAVKGICKLIHIESGLRSFDTRMPEELNRTIIDHLADVLFVTEPSAEQNLRNEGLHRFHRCGNLMLESLVFFLEKFPPQKGTHVVATIHREENLSLSNLQKIITIFKDIPNLIFVLHPHTKKKIAEFGLDLGNIQVKDALGYFDFLKLVTSASGVITDSGGIQEETSYLGIPCATLRDNTERPVTLLDGSNKLFSLDSAPGDILKHLQSTFPGQNIPYGDTNVSKRIFEYL